MKKDYVVGCVATHMWPLDIEMTTGELRRAWRLGRCRCSSPVLWWSMCVECCQYCMVLEARVLSPEISSRLKPAPNYDFGFSPHLTQAVIVLWYFVKRLLCSFGSMSWSPCPPWASHVGSGLLGGGAEKDSMQQRFSTTTFISCVVGAFVCGFHHIDKQWRLCGLFIRFPLINWTTFSIWRRRNPLHLSSCYLKNS